MDTRIALSILPILLFSSSFSINQEREAAEGKTLASKRNSFIETEDYELHISDGKQHGVLILFPGYPENPAVVKSEFKIIAPALAAGISVALMKFNRRIWLEEQEKELLSDIINKIFAGNKLETKQQVFIGGFSSGGSVGLLLSNYLWKSESNIKPTRVFAIDSPVDLLGLYENAERNVARNFSDVSVRESTMIIDQFETNFGKPENGIEKYEKYSVYTHKTKNTANLSHLKNVKIRLYTEPDIKWWQENRQNEYEDMNAYFIKHLSDELIKKYGNNVAFIATQNKGYRANGDRHPHSWSIVDVPELVEWMLGE